MDKLLYTSILEDIEKSNFQNVINQLSKIHDENDKNYLYLRSYLYFMQKNFYLSLDTVLVCITKFPNEFEEEGKFINILSKVLQSIERFDLLKRLKNFSERNELLNNLASWQYYKYK